MYIGVDVGGTNLVAGLVDDQGQLLRKNSVPAHADRGPEAMVADMMTLIAEVSADAVVASIGVGIPGVVDNVEGRVVYTCNIPFSGLPLTRLLQERWPVPVRLGNDANVAALGEYLVGAARDTRSMVMVTLGTGVGGGIIIDGHMVEGVGGAAAELGHMVVKKDGARCGCGRLGCWEAYASATGLIRMTNEAMQAHPDSLLWAERRGAPPHVSGRTAFDAARSGDAVAQAVVDEYIAYLAEGLVNLVNLLQPEMICLGGGVCHEGDALLVPLREIVQRHQFCRDIRQTAIQIAALGNDAGLIGAALMGKAAQGNR